jgi:putative porin
MSKTLGVIVAAGLFAVGPAAAQTPAPPALKFSGDFRVRYEHNTDVPAAPRGREVVRFRLGATYALQEDITVRARLATGDPEDPNSTDITLSSFVNDLTFSLDLASVEWNRPKFGAFAGKFTNPFLTTEMVWDGDVNPQGAGGRLKLGKATGVTTSLTAMYFVMNQRADDSTSDMGGGQLMVASAPGKKWRVTGAAAYYDYRIGRANVAEAGDIRGNRLDPAGPVYLSDFNLVDALVFVDYAGFGTRFPFRFVGEYVHNNGANDLNTGFSGDVYVGKAGSKGDFRARYGYAQVETDAILAAFAHDNTTLGTNSDTHTLSVDVTPRANSLLTATLYHYRVHAPAGEFQTRIRLNAMVTF